MTIKAPSQNKVKGRLIQSSRAFILAQCINFVYTHGMKATIQKWGNSLGIRIPKIIAEGLMLKNGSEVELYEESDKIIIQPLKKPLLKELLQGISDRNIHDEAETEGPYGKEIW
jgi:antitoxin MazE